MPVERERHIYLHYRHLVDGSHVMNYYADAERTRLLHTDAFGPGEPVTMWPGAFEEGDDD